MVRSPDGSIDERIVKEKSAIKYYMQKNPNNYRKAINKASFELCFNNPSLLLESKGILLELAKKKVHEDGYCYRKDQTRSKVLNPSTLEDEPPPPKRKKINAYECQRRIKELDDDELSGLNRHIRIKEQRLEQATASRNFKVCDELASEISELKSQWWELSTELAGFQLKSKKAVQYQNIKKNAAQQHDEHSDSDNTTQPDDSNLSPSLPTRM